LLLHPADVDVHVEDVGLVGLTARVNLCAVLKGLPGLLDLGGGLKVEGSHVSSEGGEDLLPSEDENLSEVSLLFITAFLAGRASKEQITLLSSLLGSSLLSDLCGMSLEERHSLVLVPLLSKLLDVVGRVVSWACSSSKHSLGVHATANLIVPGLVAAIVIGGLAGVSVVQVAAIHVVLGVHALKVLGGTVVSAGATASMGVDSANLQGIVVGEVN